MADAGVASSYNRLKEVREFDESKMGVKGLADSGITTIPRIFIHQQETPLSDPIINAPGGATIPVIDLAHLNSPDQRTHIVDQVREATKAWGFFQVINHGIPLKVLDDMINAIKAFHEQPYEIKARYYKREEKAGVMFTSNNDLYRAKAASWHDTLQVWFSPEQPKPEEIPDICRREVLEWEGHVSKVGEVVMELLCEGLGLKGSRLKELGFLRGKLAVNHCYPYCPQPDLTMGITSHTDSGVTVLLQNEISGLQVKHENRWVDVQPIHGALTVNIGDFIQILTNDEYKSVEHRVLANGSKETRISAVRFFNVEVTNTTDRFGPLPELVSEEKPALYRYFTVPEFVDSFYSKGLDSKFFPDKLRL